MDAVSFFRVGATNTLNVRINSNIIKLIYSIMGDTYYLCCVLCVIEMVAFRTAAPLQHYSSTHVFE